MKKSTTVLISSLFFFIGVIVGFAFAPAKNGVSIGNNSGNYYGPNASKEFDKEESKE